MGSNDGKVKIFGTMPTLMTLTDEIQVEMLANIVAAILTKRSVPFDLVVDSDTTYIHRHRCSFPQLTYCVICNASIETISRLVANRSDDRHLIFLTPAEQKYSTEVLAKQAGLERYVSMFSIDDFVTLNAIDLATEEQRDFFSVLQEIVDIYNNRLAEAETDMSLRIEVR